MHDLTSFLTTIASASASIVAILGGFIASKLLTINGERERVISRIRDVKEQQLFKRQELDEIQARVNENDALCFIKEHIEELINDSTIDQVYTTSEQNYIRYEDLIPYWERARGIRTSIIEFYQNNNDFKTNSDNIPNCLAQKYSADEFNYFICKKLISTIQRITKQRDRQKSLLGSMSIYDLSSPITDMDLISNPLQATSDYNKISDLSSELKWIEHQLKEYNEKIEELKKPKGMKAGMIIFALFSICCIIVPLLLCPICVDTIKSFWTIKLIMLGVFSFGLVVIFLYLLYLLKWDE